MKILLQMLKQLDSLIMSLAFYGVFFISEGIVRSSGLLLVSVNQELGGDRKHNILTFTLPLAASHFIRFLKNTLLKKYDVGTLSLFWSDILCTVGAVLCFWSTNSILIIIFWGVIFGSGYGIKSIFKSKLESKTDGQKMPEWNNVILSGYLGCLFFAPALQKLIEKYGFHGSSLLISSLTLNSAALTFAIMVLRKFAVAGGFGCKNHKLSKSSDDIYSISQSNETSEVTQNINEKNSSTINNISNDSDFWQKMLEDKYSFLSKSSSEFANFCPGSDSEIQIFKKQFQDHELGDTNLKNDFLVLAEEAVIAVVDSASVVPSEDVNEEYLTMNSDIRSTNNFPQQSRPASKSLHIAKRQLEDNNKKQNVICGYQLNSNLVDLVENLPLGNTSKNENETCDTPLTREISKSFELSNLSKNISKMQESLTNKMNTMEDLTKNCIDIKSTENLKTSNDVPYIEEPIANADQEIVVSKKEAELSSHSENNSSTTNNVKSLIATTTNPAVKQNNVKASQIKVKIVEYTVSTDNDAGWDEEINQQSKSKRTYRRHADSVSRKYFENIDSQLSLDPAPTLPEISNFQRKLSYVKIFVDNIHVQQQKDGHDLNTGRYPCLATLYKNIAFISLILTKVGHKTIFPLIIPIIVDLAINHGAENDNAKWNLVIFSIGGIFGNKTFKYLIPKKISKIYLSLAVCFSGTGIMIFAILSSSTFASFLCFIGCIGYFEPVSEVILHILMEKYSKPKNMEFITTTSNFISGLALLIILFATGIFMDIDEAFDGLLYVIIGISFTCSILCFTLPKIKEH